jgi:chromosome segregation ATPase
MSTEETRDRLQAARAELEELLDEQRRLDEDLEAARREDHEERMEVARSGGRIRSALASLSSRVRGVEERREALPCEIWSARIRVLELEVEHCGATVEELEEPVNQASREAREVDQERRDAEKRYQELTDKAYVLRRDQNEAGNRKHQAEIELRQLRKAGP